MNKEILSILVSLSKLGAAIETGRESREEASETLEKHAELLRKHLGGMEAREGKKAMKEAGVHPIIASMVSRIVWPAKAPKKHKFSASEKAAVLAIIPEDPTEARAWVRGLVKLVAKARPIIKAESEE